MTEQDMTSREDPRLQADPVLILSDGKATFGLKVFVSIAAIIIVLVTFYGLTYQPQSKTFVAVSGTVLPETTGPGR